MYLNFHRVPSIFKPSRAACSSCAFSQVEIDAPILWVTRVLTDFLVEYNKVLRIQSLCYYAAVKIVSTERWALSTDSRQFSNRRGHVVARFRMSAGSPDSSRCCEPRALLVDLIDFFWSSITRNTILLVWEMSESQLNNVLQNPDVAKRLRSSSETWDSDWNWQEKIHGRGLLRTTRQQNTKELLFKRECLHYPEWYLRLHVMIWAKIPRRRPLGG